jgi:omega-6 fatty acid desaturase (delta-12 desaturase)
VGRTFFGVVIHYAVVIWWPRFAFPCAEDRGGVGRVGALERLTGAMFVLAQLVGGFELQARRGGTSPMRELVLSAGLGVLVPFLLFTWLIGLVTFLHHNHEHVRWYDRREEWSFARGSLFGTVHVRPGTVIDRILLNIMFHTAHHVDTRVPLYRLPRTQRALEEVYGNRIIQSRFSMQTALETFRDCKLYDYRKHVWLDFAGHPTTASVLEAAPTHSRHQLSRRSAQAND